MRCRYLPLVLLLTGCGGARELVCRFDGDAAGRLAGPSFAASACATFPCTPAYEISRIWNPVAEDGYQDCRRSLGLAAGLLHSGGG